MIPCSSLLLLLFPPIFLGLLRDSVLEECSEDTDYEARAIPMVIYHFKPILEVASLDAGSVVDVVGIIETVGEWSNITLKVSPHTP